MPEARELLRKLTAGADRLVNVRTLRELGEAVHEIVQDIIPTDRVAVYFIDPETDRFRVFSAHGFTESEVIESDRTALDRHPGLVLRTGQMLHVPDVDADASGSTIDVPGAFKVRSRLFLPIKNQGTAIGVLGLAAVRPHHFGDYDIAVVEYAVATAGFVYRTIVDAIALRRELDLVEQQRKEILALSSPVVEVWRGVLVSPLFGRVDEARASDVMQKLLAAVGDREVTTVILDLTGLESIDAAGLDALLRIERAVSLLGCDCLFSGISAAAARTLAGMGDRISFASFATLGRALEYVLAEERGARRTSA